MKSLLDKTSSLVARTSPGTSKVAQEPLFRAGPDFPGVASPPYSNDATQAIWQDPSSYDPYLHGPPYLPSARLKAASQVFSVFAASPGTEMAGLLVFLRAVAMVHQTHHWVTKGNTSYGDHLLFERLYNGMLPEIDSVAERAVGSTGATLIADFRAQASCVADILNSLGQPGESAAELVQKSLEAEALLSLGVTKIVELLKNNSSLSRGTDNLIAGIEDKHEEHRYLLQQRLLNPSV